jgi:hypothetical protein
MKMAKASDYTPGWIDTTIHDFLLEVNEPSPSMGYALITCLDSSFQVARTVQANDELNGLANVSKKVGDGILVATRKLISFERRKRIFFGFDEVWFFSRSDVRPKPKGLVITGPAKITCEMILSHSQWMRNSGASLGLGDGTGMNFCAKLRGVAKYLIESFSDAEISSSKPRRAIA